MAALHLTFENLYDRLAWNLYKDTPTADQLVLVKELVNDGYQKFLYDFPWSFACKTVSLSLFPAIATDSGTTVTGVHAAGTTTVTASAAAFYSTMVGRSIVITDIGTFTITGYTSATVISVSGNATCAGKTFSIEAGRYALGSDFDSFVGDPVLADDLDLPRLELRSPEQVEAEHYRNSQQTGQPRLYALQPRDFTTTDGQRWDIVVYPRPDELYTAVTRQRVTFSTMTSDSEYPAGGPAHSLTILQAAMAIWEQRQGQTAGVHTQLYLQTYLPASIQADQQTRPRILGSTPQQIERPAIRRSSTATYNNE